MEACMNEENKLTLFFRNSRGEKRVIAYPASVEDAHVEMKKFMKERNFKSYYARVWEEDGVLKFDVGSHSEFFFLDGISFEEYSKEVNKDEFEPWREGFSGSRNC